MLLLTSDAVARFERRCHAKGLAERTIQFYRGQFTALDRYLAAEGLAPALETLTPDVVRGFLATRRKTSAHLAKQGYATLRVWCRFLVDEDIMLTNPMAKIEAPRLPKQLVATFSVEQITQLLQTCGPDFRGIRDLAVIMVLLDCGLRASELCTLTLEQVDHTEQAFRVWGKGDKVRIVPYGSATGRALKEYLAHRGQLTSSVLFVSEYGKPLTRKILWDIVHARCEQATIGNVRCSPHTFRHTFAVMFLRNGGDVFSLQKLLGHSDLAMTRRYAELSETDVRDKHRACSPGDKFLAQMPAPKRVRLR